MKKLAIQYIIFFVMAIAIFKPVGANNQEHHQVLVLEPIAVLTGTQSPSGEFKMGAAVDVDADGNVYIVDRGNNRVLKYVHLQFVREVGGFGNQGDQLDDPRDVDASTTLNILVADYNNERIVHFDRNLNFVAAYSGSIDQGEIRFGRVKSVTYSPQFDIFLIDDDRRQVVKLDRLGGEQIYIGGPEEPLGQLLNPLQLTTSGDQLFVSDPGTKAVMVYDFLGNFIVTFQKPNFLPGPLDWSDSGTLYVVNQINNRVLILTRRLEVQYQLVLSGLQNAIQDISVWPVNGKQTAQLFVLTEKQCLVYQITFPD